MATHSNLVLAWKIHEVAKNQTWLSNWAHTHTHTEFKETKFILKAFPTSKSPNPDDITDECHRIFTKRPTWNEILNQVTL